MKKVSIILLSLMLIIVMTACDPKMEQKPCIHVIDEENVVSYFDSARKYPSSGTCTKCGEFVMLDGISVSTPGDLMNIGNDINSKKVIGTHKINIANDIDMTGEDWMSPKLSGYEGAKTFVIDGNGYKISNLIAGNENSATEAGFIGSLWSDVALVIRNLTLETPKIKANGTPGIGAFVGNISASPLVEITNCHIVGGEINGGHWAGGIYGYAAGYNDENNGPVHTIVNIDGCSVDGVTITGDNASVGGIMGHAGGDLNTEINVSNASVTDCLISTINVKDEDGVKAGNILGTNGVGDTTLTNVTYSGNTVTNNGESNYKVYGRLVFKGEGSLTIDGDSITEAE